MPKIIQQFGLWESPISPRSISAGMDFPEVAFDHSGALLWLERRQDRGVIVVQPADKQASRDLNSEYSVKARVGYGGGDFTVGHGQIYFVEAGSGRIYRQPVESGPAYPLTPGFGHAASPVLSPDGRWLVFVHQYEGRDYLAIVDSDGRSMPQKLVSSADFYMQPAWSPDGKRLVWISWNHPNMPWDGTDLFMAEISGSGATPNEGLPRLGQLTKIAGGEQVSIVQPLFSPDGKYLAYVSDESGWWQIYLYDLETGTHSQLTHVPSEHAQPAWEQGMRTFQFTPDGNSLVFIRSQDGFSSLWQLSLETHEEQRLALDEQYTDIRQIAIQVDPDKSTFKIAFIASGATVPARVMTREVPGGCWIWRRSTSEELSQASYSSPEPVSWSGDDGGIVHGLYYPPHNDHYEGTGKPPLIVNVHGGPTSQARNRFNAQAQFFATRGYGYLEVNYRGSTGYGREYRNALRGNWGIHDVQDAVSGARYLHDQRRVDGSKMVIIGGSAGGFTVLKALQDYPGFFKAGICLYGISNQFTAAVETHKFEERYSDSLLGPLPESAEVYRQRSPIFFADKIRDAIALFQGEDDQVVLRNQSDEMVALLQRNGVPHLYQVYPGEGHGFRKSETIENFYQVVEKFLRQYVIYT